MRLFIIFKFLRQVIFAGIMGLASSKKKTNCTVSILHVIFLDDTLEYVTTTKVTYPQPNKINFIISDYWISGIISAGWTVCCVSHGIWYNGSEHDD